MAKFDFPRLKLSDLVNLNDMSNEDILKNMINLAKKTITGETQEEKLIGGNLNIEDLLEKKADQAKPEVVKGPSMMIMACNLIEVVRLREELVQRIHETDILSLAYKQQLKSVNKDSFKLIL